MRRLRTSYIDIYWVHMWDRHTLPEETMRALDDEVRAGKILYVGISDTPAWLVAQANTLAQWRGWTADLELPDEAVARLDSVSKLDLGFPATFISDTGPWVFGAAAL